jgi:predicted O-methyltransferase YrrM
VIKRILGRLFGPIVVGALDYYRFPAHRESWGGPMNGQQRRQQMVESLFSHLEIGAVVETGTFRGTTTRFLADLCDGPVVTVEADPRAYGFARMALRGVPDVRLLHDDSRSALEKVVGSPPLAHHRVLYYLDAHWGEDLPLREEVTTIFAGSPRALVLIDDFEVPDDPGYTYDDYGAGKALTLDYLGEARQAFGLRVYFPSATAAEETGAKRGCVLLVGADDHEAAAALATNPHLRPYPA